MRTASASGLCDLRDFVELFAIDALPATERARFAGHLEDCTSCRRELEHVEPVVRSLASWPGSELKPPDSLWERLASQIGQADLVASPFATLPELDAAQWEQAAPGIFCKILAKDVERDRVSMLVRLDPGVEYPPHTHAGVEELHLLDGELWIDERKLFPGDYNRAERGTRDRRVWSETGCTCVLITSPSDELR